MSSVASDQPARERAIAAAGSVLVQAPAGSGKTTLLAQRYLRLLATVDAPECILALTFTRRAAQEMRERVLHALATATAAACPPSLNPQTWELGRAAHARMRLAGIDLSQHPARFRIETIDAFNAWLAGQLPLTAGTGSRLPLSTAPRRLYEEAARRTLAHDEPGAFGAAVENVLVLDDLRWQRLVDLIAGMLPSRDRWLPLLAGRLEATALEADPLLEVRRHLDEDLRLLLQRRLAAARAALGPERLVVLSRLMHAAARRIENPSSDLLEWQQDAAPLREHPEDVGRWRACAALLLTTSGDCRKRLTKNEGFPPHCADKGEMLDLLLEFERQAGVVQMLAALGRLPAPRYEEAQWIRVRAVARVLVLAAAQLEQVFRERGLVDFPAVSMAARRALGSALEPTDLALRLDYRLQHLLIDEFQDTSSAQLELVKLLTAGWQRGDGRTVFCVGDPMQSIYGFRQAEVRAFLELADEGIGDVEFEVLRLRSNFRSAKPLVQWINACFARVLPTNDDRDRGAIAFRASDSGLSDAGAADAAVQLRGFGTRREEAESIATLIRRQRERHPDWRIAILVRARSHARDLAASLRGLGVPFRAVDLEPLEDRPMVRDLTMLITALLHFGDRRAWLAMLRSPWVGLTLADLLKVARAAPMLWDALSSDELLQGLSEDGRERCRRLHATLDAALRCRGQGTLARWVEQTWLALGGAACMSGADDLANVAHVFARLRELEQQGLPDPADLAASFSDLHADPGGVAAVEIMTIHKAKGLEFDLVVVPGLDRRIPNRRDEFLLFHPFARSGRDGMVMAARPGVGDAPDPLFEFLRDGLEDAAALEAERLLYVAATRAKWQLHLTALVEPAAAAAAAPAWRPVAGSLLAVLWPVVGAEFLAGTVAATAAAAPVPPRGGPLLRVPAGWTPEWPVGLRAAPAAAVVVARREEMPVFDWAGETARRVGTLVHAELQHVDPTQIDEAALRRRQPHYARWLAQHGVPPERLEEASGRVLAALLAVRRDARAAWLFDPGHRDVVAEHALTGWWQGAVVRVVFDRSFVDAAGVRWVVDYKTSQHGGGRVEEFLDREVERYRAQMQRYGDFARQLGPQPVRVGLYFPLMQAWREWSP